MRPHLLTVARAMAFVLPLSAQSLHAQSAPSSLSVHGYLTQGYGISSRDTVLGLTPAGTTDYRRAAIVGRYTATPRDNFVVQIGHRRLGNSPSMQFEDNLKVDRAFYEHRFDFGTSVRVGKDALPSGLFNETRYVGTLLPFYRAPFSVYNEGAYVSESINGVVASHVFRAGEPWQLSAQAYVGDFGLLELGTIADSVGRMSYQGARMESKNVYGGQLWLSTPVEGVRIGGGARHKEDHGGLFAAWRDAGDRGVVDWNAGFEAIFEKWQLRTETSRVFGENFDAKAEYVQVGVSPLPWLSVNAQSEFREILAAQPPAPMIRVDVNRDDAVGINFLINPTTVLKFEQHRTKGFNYEQVVNPFGPRMLGSYFIASLSTAF